VQVSLMGTIVGLAHDFVGSNNINLLLPIGQFGTRFLYGEDSAAPRYIATMLKFVTLMKSLHSSGVIIVNASLFFQLYVNR
jgi:DNA gyrase/topoisomerase IV subunit A